MFKRKDDAWANCSAIVVCYRGLISVKLSVTASLGKSPDKENVVFIICNIYMQIYDIIQNVIFLKISHNRDVNNN